ncbi:NACHT domain-containing protein [Saccharothrix xinjiangensis]
MLRVTLLTGPDRTDASGYGQFVLAAVGLVIAVVPLLKSGHFGDRPELDLDELTDVLVAGARVQWIGAAADRGLMHPRPLPIRWHRSPLPVAGPLSEATTPRAGSFDPLPGLARVTPAQLREGTHRTLHRIYGGLASGRLIIMGEPGSGKSSAAILLLLDALEFRDHTPVDQRARVPVPVLFTLASWNPDTTPIQDWLAAKMTELPPLTGRGGRVHAAALIAAGRVAVILDGLDEIPEHRRPVALRALADQATFRLVLLTRTTELAAASQQQILTGAACIELRPLTSGDAAAYLRHNLPVPPPRVWRNLLNTLAAGSMTPATAALTNPLTITLLRDIYHHVASVPGPSTADPDELLDTTRFPTSDDITHHLLDHAITNAYTPRPGQPPPPFTPQVAQHALSVIARHLRDHNTRDLRWWQISAWVPRTTRSILNAIAVALATGLLIGLAFGLVGGLIGGIVAGIVVGVLSGLAFWTESMFGPPLPFRVRANQIEWRSSLAFGLAFGIVAGLTFGPVAGIVSGLTFGVLVGHPEDFLDAPPPQPTRFRPGSVQWGSSIVLGLISGLTLGLTIGFMPGLLVGITFGFTTGLVSGLGERDLNQNLTPSAQHRGDLTLLFGLAVLYGSTGGLASGVSFTLIEELMPRLVNGLTFGLADQSSFGLVDRLMLGLVGGLAIGVVTWMLNTAAWRTAISQLYLAGKYRVPLRLLKFLADANKRHLLRTVGPVYQFRHATLQDRLAPPAEPIRPTQLPDNR